MDLRDFEYLIALEEEGSVSKAAERLYMAQSSLSQFLQQTESELGVKLFLRTSKGIRPTPNGEIFIGHLRKILADYRMARGELWDSEGMKGGRVVFGISSFRGQQTLPQILLRFAEKYPEVKVRVVEANSRRLEELLLDGKLDVAVVALPAAKLKNEAHFLKKEELYLVASRKPSGEGQGPPHGGGAGAVGEPEGGGGLQLRPQRPGHHDGQHQPGAVSEAQAEDHQQPGHHHRRHGGVHGQGRGGPGLHLRLLCGPGRADGAVSHR